MASFTDIPPELRNLLYSELLLDNENLKHLHPSTNDLALFTVSKHLHSESTSYFYQNTNITIDARCPLPTTSTPTATILPPIADKYLPYLRHLTLHTLTGQARLSSVRRAASIIASLSHIGARLEEVDVIISSPLSQLLSSRVDDPVMDSEHPMVGALRSVLASGVVKVMRVRLRNAWFAPGVARSLHQLYSAGIEFFVSDEQTLNFRLLERGLVGQYSSSHLLGLGLDYDDIDACSTCASTSTPSSPTSPTSFLSTASLPSSIPSSLCSAFADLDAFSVTSFDLGHEDNTEKHSDASENGDSLTDHDPPDDEHPFFTDDDIQDWEDFTTPQDDSSASQARNEDIDMDDDDAELQAIPQTDITSLITNIEEIAQHTANEEDVNYLTNFAPELLLGRFRLGHLV